jgi:hypothetical protein
VTARHGDRDDGAARACAARACLCSIFVLDLAGGLCNTLSRWPSAGSPLRHGEPDHSFSVAARAKKPTKANLEAKESQPGTREKPSLKS